jgi:predicted dehydrogenase
LRPSYWADHGLAAPQRTTTNQLRDFVQAIANGGTARPNFADALHVQQVVDAVIESARANAWVTVRGQSV